MPAGQRSLALAAWGTAWLLGEVGFDELTARLGRGEAAVSATGPDGRPTTLARLLAEVQGRRARGLIVALPVPGDVRGLPGPGPLTDAALVAGEAVRVLQADGGAVPVVEQHGTPLEGVVTTTDWHWYDAPAADDLDLGATLREADQALKQALLSSTEALAKLDVAKWSPEIGEALLDLRRAGRKGRTEGSWLPECYPPEARQLLSQADVLGRVVELALSSESGAVSAAEIAARTEALRDLDRAVRDARCTAVNCLVGES